MTAHRILYAWGPLTISDGATFFGEQLIGVAEVSILGAGAVANCSQFFRAGRTLVGNGGVVNTYQVAVPSVPPATGFERPYLLITNGGTVNSVEGIIGRIVTNALGVVIGLTNNAAIVTGGGSVWVNSNALHIGYVGYTNSLLVTNSGLVRAGGVFVGTEMPAADNLLKVSGGTLVNTNAAQDAPLDVRRGRVLFAGGSITTDRLLLTNGAASQFSFNSGTLKTRSTTVTNGVPFHVGNGVAAASYFLNGAATNLHTFAAGLVLTNQATLAGNGTIGGPLTAQPGSFVSPGALVGKLIFSNSPSLAGTMVMEISKTGGALTNDVLVVTAPLTYGGSLIVTNIGPDALAVGNTFQLFSAAGYAGSFTAVTLPPLASGRVWNNQLAVNGTLTVVSATLPVISGITQSRSNVIFTVTNGVPGGTWNLLTATNVALPLANWITNRSGVFDLSGNVTLTNSLNLSEPRRFYLLSLP